MGNTEEIVQATLEHMPQYQGLEIHSTLIEIVFLDNQYYLANDPEYIAKKDEIWGKPSEDIIPTDYDLYNYKDNVNIINTDIRNKIIKII